MSASLFRLSAIRCIRISGNKLGGRIPDEISNLKYLEHLDLSDNRFKGSFLATEVLTIALHGLTCTGAIPSWFSNLEHLRVLRLSENALEGYLPSAVFGAALEELDLSDNKLGGMFPANWKTTLPLNIETS